MKVVLRFECFKILILILCLTDIAGLSAQALTVGEVYDYQAGDEFIFQRNRKGPPIYTNLKVLSRTDFGDDSVRYLFESTVYNLNTSTYLWESDKFSYRYTYTNLNDTFFESFRMKDTMQYDSFGNQRYLVKEFKDSVMTDSCGALVNFRYLYTGAPLSEHETYTYKAIAGVGILSSYELDGGKSFFEDKLLYSKKGNNNCGNSKSIPTSVKTVNKKNAVKIWPNPANDWLNIGGEALFGFRIYDVAGREVLSAVISDENPIDISSLSNGLYSIVVVTAAKGTLTFKLTVQ